MKETFELDMRDLVKVLLKKAWIILLCAILVASAVLVYTVGFVAPQYTASVRIYVNNNSSKNSIAISSNDLAVALRLVNTYVLLLESEQVLEEVIENTGSVLTVNQLRNMMSAEALGETEMFEVKITSPSAQLSADLANALADVAPEMIATFIEGSSAKVIDYARVPTSRSSPNYVSSTVLGFLLGMLGAIAVIVVKDVMDTRIKNENDLTKICPLPVLGKIPDMCEAVDMRARR